MPDRNVFVKFIQNEKSAAQTRRVNHTDGREYLIAPAVSIVAGVMNDILYAEEDITAYIEAWNGRPLVIAHPQDLDGEHISANSPEIFARSPGFFFNAHFEDGRLKGDWWIDTAKAKEIGGHAQALVTALEHGRMFEQSTGLFTDIEPTEGEFNGEQYEGIARNIRPDHVAILFDEVGACSIEDGCGAPRVNSEPEVVEAAQVEPEPITNDETEQSAVWQFLKPLAKLLGRVEESTEMRINADSGEGGPDTGGDVDNNESEVNMSRDELIEALLGRETGFLTRAMLEAADDETLAALWSQFGTAPEAEAEPEVEADDDPGEEHPAENAFELPPELVAVVTMVGEMGGIEALREALLASREQSNAHIDKLIGDITANSDQFEAEDLQALPQEMLQKMAGWVRSTTITPNFGGRGVGVHVQPEDEFEEWTPREVN